MKTELRKRSDSSDPSKDIKVHAHLHAHADGTVHNHYHSHAGGDLPHSHEPDGDHSHGKDPSRDRLHIGASQVSQLLSEDDIQYSGMVGTGESHEYDDGHPPVHRHSVVSTGNIILDASDLSFAYSNADEPVFEGVSLQARAGSVLAILGNNGAGKSTLLSLLAGLLKPLRGSVTVGARAIGAMDRREIARHVAFVAQQQRIPHFSVYDQVLLGRKPHVGWSLTEYDRMVVARTIAQLKLEAFSTRYLDELSGGERQKVFIARALAQEPEVLLLDEPTSALDPKNQIEVLRLVRRVTQEESIATVMVIHDINLALRFCDRFLLVKDGKTIVYGDRSVVTDETLSETYGIPFKVTRIDDIPIAIPLQDQ